MAMTRRNRMPRAMKTRRNRRGGRGKTAKLSKPVARAVRSLIMKKAETKYVVFKQNLVDIPVSNRILGGGSWQQALPQVEQGSDSYQRDGNRITNVTTKVHLTFYYPYGETFTQDYFVRVYYGQYKALRTFPARLTTIAAGTLLDNGDGTQTDWDPSTVTSVVNAQKPAYNENWSLRYKQFRITRNNGVSSNFRVAENLCNIPNLATTQHHNMTLVFKHKGALNYTNGTLQYPENWCPIWCAVAWEANDGPPDLETNVTPVHYTSRVEQFFKDV